MHRVPLAELLDPANRFQVSHPSGYVGAAFDAAGLLVWGFTAGLLDRMLRLGRLGAAVGPRSTYGDLRPLPPGRCLPAMRGAG